MADECIMDAQIRDDEGDQSFSTADDTTDVTFIVEEKKIHFHRDLLSECSPVFSAMFSHDFQERSAKEIPLPDTKHGNMVTFLKQIHPAYRDRTPITDESLQQLLPLADKFHAQNVLDACEGYILSQLATRKTCSQLTFYLLLCEMFRLEKHRHTLIELCASAYTDALKATACYEQLSLETRLQIMERRCISQEEYIRRVEPVLELLRYRRMVLGSLSRLT